MSSEQKIMMLDPLEMSKLDFRDERKILSPTFPDIFSENFSVRKSDLIAKMSYS